MSDIGLHFIAEDLADTWLEDWSGAGLANLEEYLAKYAAFLGFLDGEDQ